MAASGYYDLALMYAIQFVHLSTDYHRKLVRHVQNSKIFFASKQIPCKRVINWVKSTTFVAGPHFSSLRLAEKLTSHSNEHTDAYPLSVFPESSVAVESDATHNTEPCAGAGSGPQVITANR